MLDKLEGMIGIFVFSVCSLVFGPVHKRFAWFETSVVILILVKKGAYIIIFQVRDKFT